MRLPILTTVIMVLASFTWPAAACAEDQPDAFSNGSTLSTGPKAIENASPAPPALAPCLVPLKSVSRFDGRYTSYGASKSNEYLLYEAAAAQGAKIKQDLDWMLKNASPAGKLYAAMLLKRIDNAAGNQALHKLEANRTEVLRFRPLGCVVVTATLSEAASELISLDKQGRIKEIMIGDGKTSNW